MERQIKEQVSGKQHESPDALTGSDFLFLTVPETQFHSCPQLCEESQDPYNQVLFFLASERDYALTAGNSVSLNPLPCTVLG